jgi:son of sevenless-like protein
MASALPLQPKISSRVRAIYSYYSEESSALSFKKGDQIVVLAKLDSGWWDGW